MEEVLAKETEVKAREKGNETQESMVSQEPHEDCT